LNFILKNLDVYINQGICPYSQGKGSAKRRYMVVETAVEVVGVACGNIAERNGLYRILHPPR